MAGALAGMSSCGSTRNLPLSSIEGEWDIIEINGTVVVPAPGQEFPYIGFDTRSGQLHGSSGCNRMMGSFSLDAKPGKMGLGTIATTRMACPDMSVEQNVLAALARVKKYKALGESQMALCGSSGRPLVVLQRKAPKADPAALGGRWLVRKAGGAGITANEEGAPFIELDMQAMKLHGNAGCNIINGNILTEGKQPSPISFPQVISTMMACPDMQTESRILKALGEVRSWERVEDGNVGLYDENKEQVLLLAPAE